MVIIMIEIGGGNIVVCGSKFWFEMLCMNSEAFKTQIRYIPYIWLFGLRLNSGHRDCYTELA